MIWSRGDGSTNKSPTLNWKKNQHSKRTYDCTIGKLEIEQRSRSVTRLLAVGAPSLQSFSGVTTPVYT